MSELTIAGAPDQDLDLRAKESEGAEGVERKLFIALAGGVLLAVSWLSKLTGSHELIAQIPAALGAIIDDSSKGAKTGAWAGAAIGGMRRADQKRSQAQAQQQWEQEQQQFYAEKRSRYNRAYSVCLDARDYSVN